jgi:hypothetical protein
LASTIAGVDVLAERILATIANSSRSGVRRKSCRPTPGAMRVDELAENFREWPDVSSDA